MARSAGRARLSGRRTNVLVLALLATIAPLSASACKNKSDGGVSSVPDAAPPPVAISGAAVVGASATATSATGTSAAGTSDAKPAGYSRVAMGSGISSLLLVIVVVLMVWKP